jgi:hypothetical protein
MKKINFVLLFFLMGFRAWGEGIEGSSTITGISRRFNPAISLNGLFLGAVTSKHEEMDRIFRIQEVETYFTAFVDPYLKGDITLAIHSHSNEDEHEGEHHEGYHLEIEEAYVTTQNLPANLTFRIGKFLSSFGKHNLLHTHQFPFIDPPIANQKIFGEEGLNEVGIEASYLTPLPFYSEIILEVMEGENENLFESSKVWDLAYLLHLKNLWDLSESTTLEIGVSGVYGRIHNEEVEKGWSSVFGEDLTLKWKPPRRAIFHSFVVQMELFESIKKSEEGKDRSFGLTTSALYQFSRRWWIGGRYDLFKNEENPQRISFLVAFVPSEFTAIRFQYNVNLNSEEAIHEGMIQLNFTIGSHPAHKY